MNNNFLETPIYDTLKNYLSKDPIRMHVPFHTGISNNEIIPKEIYNIDISEVSGYDIEGKENPIFQSEKITADFFRVSHSFYLTGGASVGLLASMIALNKFSKKVILTRNVHKSIINGVILAGLEPVWLEVEFLEDWGVFSKTDPKNLKKLLSKEKDIAGCVIVSPTYEGVISNVKTIADICHSRNIPLIVDEAHGAHLHVIARSVSDPHASLGAGSAISIVNSSEIASGLSDPRNDNADIVIQSWHKSLGSLTQSGVLHLVNEKYFTYDDIKRSLDLVSSTSPSFLLLLSLELTRKHLVVETRCASSLRKMLQESIILKEEINKIKNLCLFDNDDPFKIYLKAKKITGIDFAYELYKHYSIEIESANDIGFLMMIGRNFNNEIKNKILEALNEISRRGVACYAPTGKISRPQTQQSDISPREAFILGFKNKKDLEYECDVHAPCPPGYAINIPGNKKC